ncbi:MAG: sensor histidine kinase, partial [Olivibacter sp.]|nr:sensor histidine kinase [Olivibacter sp. UJ_SKK_5.1]
MPNHNHYRKNYWLIITFAVLASLLFIIALGFAKKYARKLVENEFVGKKIDVLDKNIESYNDLFFNKIPEVSFYQG